MKKIIRTVTMIMAIVVMLSQPMITYAQQFRLDDSDNWIAVGGVNTYDGTKATTEEEVKALETRLLSEGYIQICGQGVTQTEDYKLLINYWRDKSSPLGGVVPGVAVIQAGVVIVVIATTTNRVGLIYILPNFPPAVKKKPPRLNWPGRHGC